MVTMRSPSGQMPPVLQYVLFFTVVYTFAKETPSMTLNSRVYPNGSEVELPERSPFTLHCHGNGSSAGWSSSAFMLRFEDSLGRTLTVGRSAPRHTGTYRCGDSWIHLYIRGPADSASVFVAPKRIPNLVEGRDFLLECLVTDPSVGQLALRRAEGPGGLPPGTAVTFDPRRGALIRNVSLAFRGHYVCSAQREGREFTSVPFLLMVDARLPGPPVVSIGQGSYVRIVGESLAITCFTTNPNHRVIVTWTHTHLQGLSVTEGQENKDTAFHKNLTLIVPSVQRRHGGRFTCTATNQAGNATATADLTVVDGPYLRVYLQPVRQANVSTVQVTAEKLVADASANATFSSGGANGSAGAEASVVEVWEGRDVTLAFLAEAYPPLRRHQWDTPWLNNTSHQESAVSQPDRLASWLLLRKIRFEDRGNYSFFFSSPVFSGSHTIDLRVYRSPTVIIRLTGNQTLTCSSAGYPLPSLHWYTCPRTADTCGDNATYQLPEADQSGETMVLNEEVHRELVLTSNSDDVTVECVARSQMGVSRDFYVSYLPLPSRQARPVFFTSILIGSSSAALILLLLLLALFYKYKQKPRYEIRWKIIDANQGNQYIFIDPTQLPYNDMKWEFPREQLQLGLVVGAGAFGKVVEATAYGLGEEDSIKKVAVKMLKPSAHSEESEALMSELKILSHLGYHDNIVNLLGACTRGGPMLMITEYCYNGDLLNFLRGRASISDAEEGYKNMEESSRSDSGISCSEYQEMQQVTRPLNPQTLQGEENGRFSLLDLFQFSHQVALGMDFLSSRNCIHRDVAARNVLLTEFRVAKICDFGLARDITDDDNYIIKGNARLPVKWMSPESIFQCVYTTQSDVWSYGVLLWEIFSLGQSPYPNVVVDAYFYKMIKSGRHMSKPEFATTEIYQLMIGCWNLEPTHRPTFTEIGQLIKSLLPTNEAVTHQNGARSDLDRQQSVKSETEDGPQQDVFQEAEPLMKKKMMKNVYH